MHILDLPNVVLIEIFEYLSYDEVSKKRLVSYKRENINKEIIAEFINYFKKIDKCFV